MSLTNDDGTPRRMIYLGSIDAADTIIIPPEIWEPATKKLDDERAARELAAEKARLATMQSARANGRLRKALTAVFGRRMK
jgi:hypothetical protein